MSLVSPLRCRLPVLLAAVSCMMFTGRARAYVDLSPNLSKVISDSKRIAVVEVVEFDAEKHRVVLKEIRALKGDLATQTEAHEVIAAGETVVPRPILQWARPGARAVLFVSGDIALVCHGQGWYQVKSLTERTWKLSMERPDLPLSYYGPVSRLADAIALMIAGKDAVITTVPHGAEEGASFDLALNRSALPGGVKVQRIRANMKMPAVVMSVSANAAYLIGPGPVDENDLPGLLEQLKSPEPAVRAEAAGDIGSLGKLAKDTRLALGGLLTDPDAGVRMATAAALLGGGGLDSKALTVLSQGLESKDAATRRAAAEAAGYVGRQAGAQLTPALAKLLKDADAGTRIAALQAIAVLGPAAAAAAPDVRPLLDDPQMMIDAADALGRMGEAARPVPVAMVKMLASEDAAVRWAAVRGMAQIGGAEAHPAVDFIIKALPKAPELDSYNMHIYLALLGPVAKDAVPAIRAAGLKNPVLPTATLWAIEPENGFPWQLPARGRMAMTGDDGPEFARFIYDAYVAELGSRLRPVATMLAKELLDGTAGDVPEWGYKILDCAPEDSLAMLQPHLADKDLAMRERAAVAIGFMGSAAHSAQAPLQAALAAAATDREKRLLQWSLRQVARE